jgi:glycosyltransferase involved in cell wall biosynthesis
MKIAAILDSKIGSGGVFSQSVSALLQMARLCKDRFTLVVYTSVQDNIPYLQRLGIKAQRYKTSFLDGWIDVAAASNVLRRVQERLRYLTRFERTLIADDVDLVYFLSLSPQCLALQKLNYLTTAWDLAHRDMPEFPEVREFFTFHIREFNYSSCLSQAVCVFCDSSELASLLTRRYGIDRERLLVMPFSPGALTAEEYSIEKNTVLSKHGLKDGYYFYPAQFWPHKNHVRILFALRILMDKGINIPVAFCGTDQGNLAYVKSMASFLGVSGLVHFLGFVHPEDMRGLYEGAIAVVMPTYFGPTNIPPLEAWRIGKPLIYSRHLSGQSKDAAILVDPDSPESLAKAMVDVLSPETSDNLILKGKERLAQIDKERACAEQRLLEVMATFEKRLSCWKLLGNERTGANSSLDNMP